MDNTTKNQNPRPNAGVIISSLILWVGVLLLVWVIMTAAMPFYVGLGLFILASIVANGILFRSVQSLKTLPKAKRLIMIAVLIILEILIALVLINGFVPDLITFW